MSKTKEITCILEIEESKYFTNATICYRTKDGKLLVLGKLKGYYEEDEPIIEELRKEIDE